MVTPFRLARSLAGRSALGRRSMEMGDRGRSREPVIGDAPREHSCCRVVTHIGRAVGTGLHRRHLLRASQGHLKDTGVACDGKVQAAIPARHPATTIFRREIGIFIIDSLNRVLRPSTIRTRRADQRQPLDALYNLAAAATYQCLGGAP